MGGAMPPPPAPRDPVHAPPLETAEVVLPPPRSERQSRPSEPGEPLTDDVHEASWSGVHGIENMAATFEPGVESVDADTWDEPTQVGVDQEERHAQDMLKRGELGEALRLYQELAIKRPDQPALWDRVAEIALMLQQRSRE
jgi:hypothetical protein